MTLKPTQNIVLIGMPGAGKSTLGVLLAKAIGYDFIDTDLMIQRQAGMTLGHYLADRGYQALRQLEAEVICALDHAGTVIATGGSAVYSDAAMQHLRASGRVVFLHCGIDILDQRIASMNERGIAAPSGQTSPMSKQSASPCTSITLRSRWTSAAKPLIELWAKSFST